MNSKVNEIVYSFNGGFYCSQAILSAYSEEMGLDKDTARKISCGMAAGIARLGLTCGTVLGAYLVISLKYGNCQPDDKESLEKTFALIQEFDRRFTEKHDTTNCRELLGADLRTGDADFVGRQVQKICPVLVKSAAEILEDVLRNADEKGIKRRHG